MAAGKWKLFIDDTGAIGEGTYSEVTAAISAPVNQARTTVVAPVCIGDSFEKEEPIVVQLAVNAQIKVKKGDAIEARLHAAFLAGTAVGVLVATGDVNASGADGAGHIQAEFNGLVKQFNLTVQTGSTLVYDTVIVPHADSSVDPALSISTSS